MDDVSLELSDPHAPESQALMTALSAELEQLYGEDVTGQEFHGIAFLIVKIGETPVGCGGLMASEGQAEIKRMYVAPAWRGRGLAGRLLDRLETLAAQRGFTRVRLETGTLQLQALALYQSKGYIRIPNYPPYLDNPDSICFGKAVEEWARGQGCTEMASDTAQSNLESRAAHARLGFSEEEVLVHMRKPL